MSALFLEAVAPCNLPFTALLAMVIGYWLLVGLGALDFDLDIIDVDLGNLSDGGDLGDTPAGPINTGGAWLTLGNFIGIGKVPLVVWGTFFALFLWAGAMGLNHYFNPLKSMWMAALLLMPNLVGSMIGTRVTVWPLGKLFAAMAEAQAEIETVIGREAIVVSVEIDSSYGQIEIANAGAPVRINAKVKSNQPAIPRGAAVCIDEAGPDSLYYYVSPLNGPGHD